MSFFDDVGTGLTELGRKTPIVGDFFDNPEADAKDQAYRDAIKKLEAAQGDAAGRHQQLLQQSLAYFNPTSQLLGQMYGHQPGQADFAQFFQSPQSQRDGGPRGNATPATRYG